jgi:NitT/TauT family transport system permease protein
VTCGLLLGAWWIVVELFHIKSYFLPAPDEVLLAGWRVRAELLAGSWLTARAAVGGFLLSVLTGSLISLVFSQFASVRLGCFPYAVILQTVPIVALAPISSIGKARDFRV